MNAGRRSAVTLLRRFTPSGRAHRAPRDVHRWRTTREHDKRLHWLQARRSRATTKHPLTVFPSTHSDTHLRRDWLQLTWISRRCRPSSVTAPRGCCWNVTRMSQRQGNNTRSQRIRALSGTFWAHRVGRNRKSGDRLTKLLGKWWWTAGGSNSRPPRCERRRSQGPSRWRTCTSA